MCGNNLYYNIDNNYNKYRQLKVCEKCDKGLMHVCTGEDGLEYACCEKCDNEYPIQRAKVGESMMRSEAEIREQLNKMNIESVTTEVDSFETANYLLGVMEGLKWALGEGVKNEK